MKTKRVFYSVFALVVLSAILACSFVSKVLTDQPDVSTKEPDATSEQSDTGEEENLEAIIGTWKQVNFQGVGGSSNVMVASYGWFDGYYYVGTVSMGQSGNSQGQDSGSVQPVLPKPAEPGTGSGEAPQPQMPAGQDSTGSLIPAEIWRTRDGSFWEVVGEPGLGNPQNFTLGPRFWRDRIYVVTAPKPSLLVSKDGLTFELINGDWSEEGITNLYLYIIDDSLVLFGQSSQYGLQAWLSNDGIRFEKVLEDGLGDPANTMLCVASGLNLESLNGWYYVGIINNARGGEVWRTKDGRQWEKSLTAGFDDPQNIMFCSLIIHKDRLYFMATQSSVNYKGVNILRTADGKNWEKVVDNGFGIGEHQAFHAVLQAYQGALYLVTWNEDPRQGTPSTGFRLWKSPDGESWQQVGEAGFGNPKNFRGTLHVIRGVVYLVTLNPYDGNEIWRSTDGENWDLFFTAPASEASYGGGLYEVSGGLEYLEHDLSRGIQIWRYGP